MTTARRQSDRIIHDLKNLLSVLLLAIDNLAKDKEQIPAQGRNLVTLADLAQELIVQVDKLAEIVGADSALRPRCFSSEKSKIIPIESKLQNRQSPQPSGKLLRSTNGVSVGSRTHRRDRPEHGQEILL